MQIPLKGFGQTNAIRLTSHQDSNQDWNMGFIVKSIINFLKKRTMKRMKKQPQETKHHHHLLKNTGDHHQLLQLTLEEWILASPSFNLSVNNNNRIHPTFEKTSEDFSNKRLEKNQTKEQVEVEVEDCSLLLCRSQSGKKKMMIKKKKVSFRKPEVADIFTFNSHSPLP